MVVPNKPRVCRRRQPIELERKSRNIGRIIQGGSRAKGSRVGDDLVAAFEEMAKHLPTSHRANLQVGLVHNGALFARGILDQQKRQQKIDHQPNARHCNLLLLTRNFQDQVQ